MSKHEGAILHLPPPNPEDLCRDGCLGIKEAAEFLGIGRTLMKNLLPELPIVRIKRRVLIPKRALVRFAAERLEDS